MGSPSEDAAELEGGSEMFVRVSVCSPRRLAVLGRQVEEYFPQAVERWSSRLRASINVVLKGLRPERPDLAWHTLLTTSWKRRKTLNKTGLGSYHTSQDERAPFLFDYFYSRAGNMTSWIYNKYAHESSEADTT